MVRGGMIALSFIIIFAITTTVRIVRIAASNKALAASFGALLMLIMLHNISEASFAQTPNPLWLLFSFVFVGISPHIVRWYETGELEVKKVEMAREVKPTAEPAEVTAIQSHSSLHRSPTSSSRVGA